MRSPSFVSRVIVAFVVTILVAIVANASTAAPPRGVLDADRGALGPVATRAVPEAAARTTTFIGRVTHADGTPAAGLEVRGSIGGSAVTDDDGQYVLEVVQASDRIERLYLFVADDAAAGSTVRFGVSAAVVTAPGHDVSVPTFRFEACDAVWIATENGRWSEPDNWRNRRVPKAGDRVLLPESDRSVYIDVDTPPLRGIVQGRRLRIQDGATARVDGVILVRELLILSEGELASSHVVCDTDASFISIGGGPDTPIRLSSVAVHGLVRFNNSDHLVLEDGLHLIGEMWVDGASGANTIRCDGTQSIRGSGVIRSEAMTSSERHVIGFVNGAVDATLTIGAGITIEGGTLEIGGDLDGGSGGRQSIVLEGELISASAGGTACVTISDDLEHFENRGVVRVALGACLTIAAQRSAPLGAIEIATDAMVTLDGRYVIDEPIDVPDGAELELLGEWLLDAEVRSFGDGVVAFGGTFQLEDLLPHYVSESALVVIRGTFDNAGQETIVDPALGDLVLDGGAIVGGTLTIDEPYAVRPTAHADNRIDDLEINGTITLDDDAFLAVVQRLTLNGTLAFVGADAVLEIIDDVLIDGAATIEANAQVSSVRWADLSNPGSLTLTETVRFEVERLDLGTGSGTEFGVVHSIVSDAEVLVTSDRFSVGHSTEATNVSWRGTSTTRAGGSLLLKGVTGAIGPLLAESESSIDVRGAGVQIEHDAIADGGTIAFREDWTNTSTLIARNDGAFIFSGEFATDDLGEYVNEGTGVSTLVGTLDNTGRVFPDFAQPGAFLLHRSLDVIGGRLVSTSAAPLTTEPGGSPSSNGLTLDGVTLEGTIEMWHDLELLNGLHLDGGTIRMMRDALELRLVESVTIDGSGMIDAGSVSGQEIWMTGAGDVTFTIGRGVTLHLDVAEFRKPSSPFEYTIVNDGRILTAALARVEFPDDLDRFLQHGVIETGNGSQLYLHGVTGDVHAFDLGFATRVEILSGDYVLTHDIDVPPGGRLVLGGTWTNAAHLEILNGGQVRFAGQFTTSAVGSLSVVSTLPIEISGEWDGAGGTFVVPADWGSPELIGGTLRDVTLEIPAGEALIVRSPGSFNDGGTLDDVTIDGDIDLPDGSAVLMLRDHVTVNGTIDLSASSSRIRVLGDVVLDGAARIWSLVGSGTHAIEFVAEPVDRTFTLGPDTIIEGMRIEIGVAFEGASSGRQILYLNSTLRAQFGSAGPIETTEEVDETWFAGELDLINQGSVHLRNVMGDVPPFALTSGSTVRLEGDIVLDQAYDVVANSVLWLGGAWQMGTGQVAIAADGRFVADGTFALDDLSALAVADTGIVQIQGVASGAGSRFTIVNGIWQMEGGTLDGGTIDVASTASFNVAHGETSTLRDVTLNGDLTSGRSATQVPDVRFSGTTSLNGTWTFAFRTELQIETGATLRGRAVIDADQVFGFDLLVMPGSDVNAPAILGEGLTIRADLEIYGFPGQADERLISFATIILERPGESLHVNSLEFVFENRGRIELNSGADVIISRLTGPAGEIVILDGDVRIWGGTYVISDALVVSSGCHLALYGAWDATAPIVVDAQATLELSGDFAPGALAFVQLNGGAEATLADYAGDGVTRLALAPGDGRWTLEGDFSNVSLDLSHEISTRVQYASFENVDVNGWLYTGTFTLIVRGGFHLDGILEGFGTFDLAIDGDVVISGAARLAAFTNSPWNVVPYDDDAHVTFGPDVRLEGNAIEIGHPGGASHALTVVNHGTIVALPSETYANTGILVDSGVVDFANFGTVESQGPPVRIEALAFDGTAGAVRSGVWDAGDDGTLDFAPATPIAELGGTAHVRAAGPDAQLLGLDALNWIDADAILELGATELAITPGAAGLLIDGTLDLRAGGALDVDGALELSSTSMSFLELAAPSDTPIEATGAVSVAGALSVALAPGFVPTVPGVVELIVSAAARNGVFDAVTLPPDGGGAMYDVAYDALRVLLEME